MCGVRLGRGPHADDGRRDAVTQHGVGDDVDVVADTSSLLWCVWWWGGGGVGVLYASEACACFHASVEQIRVDMGFAWNPTGHIHPTKRIVTMSHNRVDGHQLDVNRFRYNDGKWSGSATSGGACIVMDTLYVRLP